MYNVKGFVDKNRDVQQDVFFDIISRSNNEFVKNLSSYQETLPTVNPKTLSKYKSSQFYYPLNLSGQF